LQAVAGTPGHGTGWYSSARQLIDPQPPRATLVLALGPEVPADGRSGAILEVCRYIHAEFVSSGFDSPRLCTPHRTLELPASWCP
jgi:hypothetical protein